MRLVLVPRGMSDMHSQATLEYMIAGVDMILCYQHLGAPTVPSLTSLSIRAMYVVVSLV